MTTMQDSYIRPAQKSDWWAGSFLDDLFDYRRTSILVESSEEELQLERLFRLNEIRAAVANFVRILTGKDIRVVFRSQDKGQSYFAKGSAKYKDSYIVISADVSDGNFDEAVGIAMHEATHVVRTNMKYFNQTFALLPAEVSGPFKELVTNTKLYNKLYDSKLKNALAMDPLATDVSFPGSYAEKAVITRAHNQVVQTLWERVGHLVLNFVEDRAIDAWQYKNSPGYREYYVALYDHYFRHPKDAKILEEELYKDKLTVDAYLFYIFSLIDGNSTDLTALPGLDKIAEVLDLKNANKKLKNTKASWKVAQEVLKIIFQNVETFSEQNDESKSDDTDDNSDSEGGPGIPDPNGTPAGSDDSKSDGTKAKDDQKGNEGSAGADGDKVATKGSKKESTITDMSTEAMKKLLEDAIDSLDKKKEMLNDINSSKKRLNSEDDAIMQNIEEGSVSMKDTDFKSSKSKSSRYGANVAGVDKTVVVNRVTPSVMTNSLYSRIFGSKSANKQNILAIDRGIQQGNILAKKVQIRTEEKVTTFNRKLTGRVERRRIHALCIGQDDIFYQNVVDSYNDVLVWISVDASGSMGSKWSKTLTLVATLAQAAKKIRGFDVVVDLRANTKPRNGASYPLSVIVFDSRIDTMAHFKNVIGRSRPKGATPEGLCIRGIADLVPTPREGLDTYFINICDGFPAFYHFNGEDSIKYTKRVVDSMRKRGVGILGYYISPVRRYYYSDDSSAMKTFKAMYGDKNSVGVDQNNVNQIAKTINKMLMEK